jgi:hypothetical protein
MIPCWMVDSGAHHSSKQFFFAWPLGDIHINQWFLSFSYSIYTTRRFEGVVASSAMIKSSPASIKTKRVIKITYYLHLKNVDVFI